MRLRLLLPFTALMPLLAAVSTAVAQGIVQPMSDADALAAQVRLLADNPLDLEALIRAGELAVRVDDATAAAAFFARAERIDPRNARIKVGQGALLLSAERPGAALRRFAEAEALGLEPRRFAAQRGFAYDLIGQQERAQRDYRLALQGGRDDETVRRYALSLGISGRRDEALEQLDGLVRTGDRGAWRSRAFVLAMTGDSAGAERIAASMMPSALGQGLRAFFDRLPLLAPADRAFAVHFGELRSSPQRIADASLVPPLTALAPEPARPVVLAAAAVPRSAKEERRDRKRRNRRDDVRDGRRGEEVAAALPPPPPPLPAPPVYRQPVEVVQPHPVSVAQNLPEDPESSMLPMPARTAVSAPPPARSPVVLAADRAGVVPPYLRSEQAAAPLSRPADEPRSAPLAVASRPVPARPVAVVVTRQPPVPPRAVLPQPKSVIAQVAAASAPYRAAPPWPAADRRAETPPPLAETTLAAATPADPPPGAAQPEPAGDVSPAAGPSPAPPSPAPSSRSPPSPAQPSPAQPSPAPPSEDRIIERIVADIGVPGAELGVGPAQPAPEADPPRPAPPEAEPSPVKAEPPPTPKPVIDRKALAAKAAADRKAIADRKAAAEKKAEDKKQADEARREPARIWVQVAGGASEHDLAKAWAAVRDKAPAAFKGRQGWTTPLRATNRVLAGPFKTDDEARSFVNTITKAGVPGFTFTSEQGQKIARLSPK